VEALRIEGLSRDFGGVRAVNNVSFSVNIGERMAIIGPNGAGKTTLFNLINGQLRPTAGKVILFGRDVTHLSTDRRTHLGQARSFQLTNLFMNLSVLENVMLAIHGNQRSRFQMLRPAGSYRHLLPKAEALLTSLDLWELRDTTTKLLGYGEQRKLEIGLSLMSEPRLLMLDEPSTGLTNEEGNSLVERVRKLGSEITVVIVDHDMDLVFSLASRIIVLHHGQIIAQGSPGEIQNDPRVKEVYIGTDGG
jgi:branched-chain amino acid transport system ATP-binding protein